MSSIFKYTILTVFCAFFIMQSVAAQDKSARPESGRPEKNDKTEKTVNGLAPITLKDLSVNFPDVEGWVRSDIQKYPTEDLGFSVNYESREGGKVTIYVYKGGKKNIPDGLSDEIIKDELDNAKGEIQRAAEMGYYERVKELKNDTVTLGETTGKIKALHTLYNFRSGERNLTSEIYIFGHQNRFIKIRATRQRDNNESGDKMVADLLKEIDAFFSN